MSNYLNNTNFKNKLGWTQMHNAIIKAFKVVVFQQLS